MNISRKEKKLKKHEAGNKQEYNLLVYILENYGIPIKASNVAKELRLKKSDIRRTFKRVLKEGLFLEERPIDDIPYRYIVTRRAYDKWFSYEEHSRIRRLLRKHGIRDFVDSLLSPGLVAIFDSSYIYPGLWKEVYNEER